MKPDVADVEEFETLKNQIEILKIERDGARETSDAWQKRALKAEGKCGVAGDDAALMLYKDAIEWLRRAHKAEARLHLITTFLDQKDEEPMAVRGPGEAYQLGQASITDEIRSIVKEKS